MEAHRIATLLPSATEIVCALGFTDQIVGRSHECDYPEAVTRLPVLTSPKFNPEGTSAEVNERVHKILSDALSVYRVDAGRLRELRPDFIVTQSQCDVCAVSMADVEHAVAEWVGVEAPTIISLAPYALSDIFADIERVGVKLGAANKAVGLLNQMRERMASIEQRTAQASTHPSITCVEWIEPLMAAGNWMPELIAAAGGTNTFGAAGQHSPWMKMEELAARDPDVLLLMPCGFNMERTAAEIGLLTHSSHWSRLKAVRSGRVYLADGNQYFNRPGPRIVESLEILSEILHPEMFRFGHEGTGWRRCQ